jgi:hypothetical protein
MHRSIFSAKVTYDDSLFLAAAPVTIWAPSSRLNTTVPTAYTGTQPTLLWHLSQFDNVPMVPEGT